MDSPLIHIGAKLDKETSQNLGKLIETVFKVGYQTHMDQATICRALSLLQGAAEVKDVTVSNCTMTGDDNREQNVT